MQDWLVLQWDFGGRGSLMEEGGAAGFTDR